ncbi:MAG: hypothetical protein IPQ07_04145 [Myxococcales bacterium]|nr:hypothetical protein [Myxococcales bacterium]
MRWSASLLVLAAVLAPAGAAVADNLLVRPPPPPPPADEPEDARPAVEWSTWFRLAIGLAPHEVVAVPRATTPPPERRGQDSAYEVALGGEMTIGAGLHGNLRIGPWLEVRGLHDVVAGGELVVQAIPKKIDMFFYDGQGVLALRAGGNRDHLTGQLAYGYLAPWNLFRTPRGSTRYMIGVRVVASYTRSIADPGDWLATIGLETEPVGALRYLLGIRSWY